MSARDLEARISVASRSWSEELRDALVAAVGVERAPALARRWADGFPPAYQDDVPAAVAVADVLDVDTLAGPAQQCCGSKPNSPTA